MERGARNHRPAGRPNGNNDFRRNGNNVPRPNGNRPNGTKKQTPHARFPISYMTLQSMLDIEGEAEFILKLSSETNGFLLLLDERQIRPDLMCLIFAALGKAADCSAEKETVQMLIHFLMQIIPKLSDNFQCALIMYSAELWKHLESPKRQMHIDAVQSLLKFLRRMQSTLYHKSFDVVQSVVHQFASQIEYINRKGNALNDRIMDLLKQLNDSMQNPEEVKAEAAKQEVLLEPPENFREISIYPSTEDIRGNHEPFIRKNIVEGNYVGGVDHYLDTQFRLLREDFVRPLRQGICEYVRLKNKTEAMKSARYRIKDLNVYRNVNIVSSKIVHNEQMHLCTFDCTPFKNLRWEYNKRMLTGSLMCLSPDDFETFFFATITGQRDPKKLAEGKFQIKLEIDYTSAPDITPLINFVMVESQVYFEAYRHSLKVLQSFNITNFPLQRYIVDLNKEIFPPSYLSEESLFCIPNGLTGDDDVKMIPVHILRNNEWPPHTDFNLDESQFQAFRAALTKQMVVIQGPPGTGKTYIGLRIVETLLSNISKFPILVVCYTNHALDQFLEGIQKFCGEHELIRIGGKSQSEAMQKLNLNTIRAEMRNSRQVPRYIHQARFECSAALNQLQDKLSSLEKLMDDVKKLFFGSELHDVIRNCNPMHLRQLTNEGHVEDCDVLNWLGFQMKTDMIENNNNDANQDGEDKSYSGDEGAAAEMAEEPDLAEEVFDEEEIREMELNRVIDDDSDGSDDEDDTHPVEEEPSHQMGRLITANNIVPLEFDDTDADGFKTANKKKNKKLKKQFEREIKKTEAMPLEQARQVLNINLLTSKQRWDLYRCWVKMYRDGICEKLGEEIKRNRRAYREQCLRFNGIRNQEDVEAVLKAKIIGMTTTGAAKYRHIISGLKPTITVVEEAAEVLEAHIVTALCEKTDHLILIGDHMQLRPNPAVFELATKFKLEISLFERLIKNQTEFFQLKQQHRMRPCISSLLVPHIYKQLLDHPSVSKYEDIKGIAKNMFFINHNHNESSQDETRSHMNAHEASFIVEFCRYIILQGYEPSQVTILTTYSGQLHLIRKLMRGQHLLSGVRATVVDNYQGEENDIILLSFVRSNEEAVIGFLKTSNRVNVALSRARKGLYCIGNFDCLAEKSPLWQELVKTLAFQKAIGDELEIYCQNHTEYRTLVAKKEDFSKVPDGGCNRACGNRLPCGHACPSICHIIDKEHKNIYRNCSKTCDKIACENQHRCPKKCHDGEECGKCMASMEKVRPQCGHSVRVLCSTNPSEAYCHSRCERMRKCGHKCKGSCGQLCEQTVCNELVEAMSPCEHMVKIKCSFATNKVKLLEACNIKCDVELKCGHICKGSCGQCKYGRLHVSCPEKCSKVLICGHPCTGKCSVDCKPCNKKCQNECVHSKCSLRCGEPCPPCMEKCQWKCEHLECTKLCSEPCDRKLCEHPNKAKLPLCGHPSIGVCGEEMPRLCRICNKDEVQTIFFGNEDNEDARFIELVDCKHVIEVDALLYWMKAESDSESNQVSIQLKKCPKCKTEIRHTKALNTFIQTSLIDVHRVKLQLYGQRKENQTRQRNLHENSTNVLNNGLVENGVIRATYVDILRKTKFDQKETNFDPKPKPLLIELDNKFQLTEQLQKILHHFGERKVDRENISQKAIEKFVERLNTVTMFIKEFQNCDQQRSDILAEMAFLPMIVNVVVDASGKPFNETGKKFLNDAFEIAHKPGNATDDVKKEFKKLIDEAYKNSSGLGITLKEKQMILGVMGFKPGHWFKCRNGHIYAIGECGGARQASQCPECKTDIGGLNYRVAAGNELATEMDGATGPAWPTNLM